MTSPFPLAALMPSPPPPPRRRRGLVPLVAVGAVLLVAVTVLVTWLAVRPASAPAVAGATAPATFRLAGDLTLNTGSVSGWKTGAECAGTGGFGDIHDGAQVTITDPAGKVLAIGSLMSGVVTDDPEFAGLKGCVFAFSVVDVPVGAGLYGVEVSHRGTVRFDEATVRSGVHLNLH